MRGCDEPAAASMRVTLSTQIAQANIFIMQSSVRPPESWERHSCQKRCRSGIVASEAASEIPLRGTFVIGAGSPEAQLPTAAIRDRSHDIQIALDDRRDKDLSEDGSPVYRNGACAPPRALG